MLDFYPTAPAVQLTPFDVAAACALWNAGDREDLELKPISYRPDLHEHRLLILKHPNFYGSTHRILTVRLNPDDGTIEPAAEGVWRS